jgi:hypothetical protein
VADPSNYASVITSESLQKKYRDTFPSQVGQGLGGDLLASGVVVPVVDFSAAAALSTSISESLQQALAFGSQTSNTATNSTATLANVPGFYWLQGVITHSNISTVANTKGVVSLVNSGVSKTIFESKIDASGNNSGFAISFQNIIYLATGDSIVIESNVAAITVSATVRQIATSDGTVVNPSGFTT